MRSPESECIDVDPASVSNAEVQEFRRNLQVFQEICPFLHRAVAGIDDHPDGTLTRDHFQRFASVLKSMDCLLHDKRLEDDIRGRVSEVVRQGRHLLIRTPSVILKSMSIMPLEKELLTEYPSDRPLSLPSLWSTTQVENITNAKLRIQHYLAIESGQMYYYGRFAENLGTSAVVIVDLNSRQLRDEEYANIRFWYNLPGHRWVGSAEQDTGDVLS